MIRPVKKSIRTLELTERNKDTKVYREHRKVLAALRKVCADDETGITMGFVKEFETADDDRDLFVTALGVDLQRAVSEGTVYDLGVVTNDMIAMWAQKAERHPIEELPWDGPDAVFVATHPNEVTFKETVSVYYVLRNLDGTLQITELLFAAKNKNFLVYTSLIAQQPLGSTLEVSVIAWSHQPDSETVGSVLNPVLMAVAFLAESNKTRLS